MSSNHIIKHFIFLSSLIFTQKVIIHDLIREKYLQPYENSTVFTTILPPEASLSTLNLSYFLGILIKVYSGFLSKRIGHSALMKTSSRTNHMYPSFILPCSMKSHIKKESSPGISKNPQVKGEIEL